MKQSDLIAEVQALIEARLAAGQDTPQPWAIEAILMAHPGIEGADAPLYRLCAREHIGVTVRQVLRRLRPDTEDVPPEQLPLPGFKHLQQGYLIERNSVSTVVKTEDLTDEEIERKAAEYDQMAVGCREHAEELRRYARTRGTRGAA